MRIFRRQITENARKDAENWNSHSLLAGIYSSAVTLRKSTGVLQRSTYKPVEWLSHERWKLMSMNKMYTNVYDNVTQNSLTVERMQPPDNRWMDQ